MAADPLSYSCAQITITGGGSANPSKVSFPGAYSPTDPGILINIYTQLNTYNSKPLDSPIMTLL